MLPEMHDLHVTERDDSITFEVRVVPRASRSQVAGVHDGALRIALTSPPVDGEANAALVAFLAKSLGVPKRAVSIVRGETGRQKLISVIGVNAAAARAAFSA